MASRHPSQAPPPSTSIPRPAGGSWLAAVRRYLAFILAANLFWEILQLPGFTDWRDGGWRWLAFIVVMGTAGDLIIAATSLVISLAFFGDGGWPERRTPYWRVAIVACVLSLIYTGYSEWRHAVLLRDWTYSALMPVVPGLGIGFFPLLQWMLIPPAGFYYVRSAVSARTSSIGD